MKKLLSVIHTVATSKYGRAAFSIAATYYLGRYGAALTPEQIGEISAQLRKLND